MGRRGILELLKERPVLGDGSYMLTLERRGYITPGQWIPEVVVNYPEAVTQLHREFLRAGADVLQAFTFYSSDGALRRLGKAVTVEELNEKGCALVWDVIGTGDTLVCGSIAPTRSYSAGEDPEAVKAEIREQCDLLVKGKVDFLLAEYFAHIREAEMAIEVMKTFNVPVACSLRMRPAGDNDDVPVGDCTVRMIKAGADMIGVNCNFDPNTCIKTLKLMKERMEKEGLSCYLMAQPVGYHCPEMEALKDGYRNLPTYPLALEHRHISRWDAAKFAREALDLGVRYIGGCCGFEPYHIRQMSEEIVAERGFSAPGVDSYPPNCSELRHSEYADKSSRANNQYWMKVTDDLRKERESMLKKE